MTNKFYVKGPRSVPRVASKLYVDEKEWSVGRWLKNLHLVLYLSQHDPIDKANISTSSEYKIPTLNEVASSKRFYTSLLADTKLCCVDTEITFTFLGGNSLPFLYQMWEVLHCATFGCSYTVTTLAPFMCNISEHFSTFCATSVIPSHIRRSSW